MGLIVEILGLVIFLGPHVFVTLRPQRALAVKQLGEWPYKGLFTVVSLAGLFVAGKGFGIYRDAGEIALWSPPYVMRYLTQLLMWASGCSSPWDDGITCISNRVQCCSFILAGISSRPSERSNYASCSIPHKTREN